MKRFTILTASLIFLMGIQLPLHSNAAESPRRLFFLHHSTGRLLIEQGNARQLLNQVNDDRGSDLVLWDHDYNYIGLSDQAGDLLGYNYSIPNDDTYPEGLHILWTTSNAARDSLMARYDIIAFKSCYPTCDITSEAQLQQYKDWYLDMRDFFDSHPEKTFIIMSPPPRHRLATTVDQADRARRFATWMTSPEYLSGHPNLVGFDFFDLLATPDDDASTRNMLRYEYELSHTSDDSHPNALANQTNAPFFVDVLVAAASPSTSDVRTVVPGQLNLANHPNPFNPTTVITFEMDRERTVSVDILDVRGQVVRHLFQGLANPGPQSHWWDGRDDMGANMGSGLYLYQVRSGDGADTGKMLLVR